ncbi:uncharacterized protein UTRI_06736 [Ustilago trichophora]|uniref:Serine aminopeptidase S33 domain-containing protein n=1 Tax=Ustilago trichophora TaxID=86804 RepID=A0A5C3ERE7_9BASI|nr:uncharacterized protein UTRI_06736 [Ustilago trichophora]
MPFLELPQNDALLRFEPGQVTFHYLVSTPTSPTFVWAQEHASELASSLLADANRSTSNSTSAQAHGGKVELDPNFPIILFLPSECFSVAHLFSAQLANRMLSSHFNLIALDPRGHGLTKDVPIVQTAGRKYDLDIKAADCLDFLDLLLGSKTWQKGIHILACSMSGLVAARMGAAWPGSFQSIMITSPILEEETSFMVESFQGIKELLEESWHTLHSNPTNDAERRPSEACFAMDSCAKLPGEVVQGFTFRWAGSESIPHHISSYLSRTWLERLVLHEKGLEAARDWWFDLYWLRRRMPDASVASIRCDILVVEGDSDLPYDRNVGQEIAALFRNARRVKVEQVANAPFLLSVKRPEELSRVICEFLEIKEGQEETPTQEKMNLKLKLGMGERMLGLDAEERFELVKVYAPDLVADSDDDDEEDEEGHHSDEEDSDSGEGESSTDPEDAPVYRLRINSVGNAKKGTESRLSATTRTNGTGSRASVSNHLPSMPGSQEDGSGPVVRTLQETHL